MSASKTLVKARPYDGISDSASLISSASNTLRKILPSNSDYELSTNSKTTKSQKAHRTGTVAKQNEALEHWKQFEMKDTAKYSNLEMGKRHLIPQDLPTYYFKQLLSISDPNSGTTIDQGISVDEAHDIVSFVTYAACPHALSQLKQAISGWRSQTTMVKYMESTQFISVLKALNHLEAQSAFNAIATRIKLVQLAEAVDVANNTLPPPQGRGNPLVKWLSAQYTQFLRLEYPDLDVGSRPWNTKLDDLKRKVKAGRRWQQLVTRFGIGVVGLVATSAPGDERNADFNRQ